jgi:hypothetical protein
MNDDVHEENDVVWCEKTKDAKKNSHHNIHHHPVRLLGPRLGPLLFCATPSSLVDVTKKKKRRWVWPSDDCVTIMNETSPASCL